MILQPVQALWHDEAILKELILDAKHYNVLLPRMRSRRFFFAPSRSRHQRRTSILAFFAFMLSAASGVRDRREARFRARSAISSRRARKSKNPGVALCACLRTVIVQSFARRRASRAEEIGFARGCSRVHFCTCFLSRVHVQQSYNVVRTEVKLGLQYVHKQHTVRSPLVALRESSVYNPVQLCTRPLYS